MIPQFDQQRLDLLAQPREVLVNGLPHGRVVDLAVAMDQRIAHGDCAPEVGQSCCDFRGLLRKPVERLARDFKLALEYGQGRAKVPAGATAVVRELAQYCRQTIRC